MATNKDFSEIIRHILQDVRVELDDAFDRNFERQAFFSENGRALSIPLRQETRAGGQWCAPSQHPR